MDFHDVVEHGLLAIPGVQPGESVFSDGDAWWVNGKQIAHFIAPGVLELRFTKAGISARRKDLKTDQRIELRESASDWLIVRLATEADVSFFLELARTAVTAHLPADGGPGAPPPEGADLERRRRVH